MARMRVLLQALCRSAGPGGPDDALDRGRAVEAGDEVFEYVGVDGAVRGLGTVPVPLDGRPQELVLEVPTRMDGEDLLDLIALEPVQAEAAHVRQHAEVRGRGLRAHTAGNAPRRVERGRRPHGLGRGGRVPG